VFEFVIEITEKYPYSPPKIGLLTKIYHPNITDTGYICVNSLNRDWSPAFNLSTGNYGTTTLLISLFVKVILGIVSLLNSPEPNKPLMPKIARHYLTDKAGYEAVAREWTIKYAKPLQ
jgi:ubiquitin-protein ligase